MKKVWIFIENKEDEYFISTYELASPSLRKLKNAIKVKFPDKSLIFGNEEWRPVIVKDNSSLIGWLKQVKVI